MARPLRALLALVALGAGCATQTIDLLSPPEGVDGGSSGVPTAGTRAGSSAGSSGAGGRSSTGGSGGAGRGGSSVVGGGTGNVASGEGGDGGQSGASSVDCVMDLDCPTGKPHCVAIAGTARFHCVECVAHANCGLGERCNFLTNECAPACTTFDDCPFSLPFCERGVCVQCLTDSHCGPNVCVFGHCEECRSTLDCPPSAPVCGESYTCRPCTGMFQCGQYRFCDLTTGRCEAF